MPTMKTDWRDRLIEAIDRDGRSLRAISRAANLGSNYLTQMRERGTAPTTQALVSLCDVLGVSVTSILIGAAMSPSEEELLRLAAGLSDRKKDLLIEMARQLQEAEPE